MCVCVYVCIYIYICVCVYMCVYMCIYMYICVHINVCTYVYTLYIYVYVYIYIYIYIYIHKHTYTVYIYIYYIYTCIYTCVYIYIIWIYLGVLHTTWTYHVKYVQVLRIVPSQLLPSSLSLKPGRQRQWYWPLNPDTQMWSHPPFSTSQPPDAAIKQGHLTANCSTYTM